MWVSVISLTLPGCWGTHCPTIVHCILTVCKSIDCLVFKPDGWLSLVWNQGSRRLKRRLFCLFNAYEYHLFIDYFFNSKIVYADVKYMIFIVLLHIPKMGWNRNLLSPSLNHRLKAHSPRIPPKWLGWSLEICNFIILPKKLWCSSSTQRYLKITEPGMKWLKNNVPSHYFHDGM